jgi:geranylgeranyl pyrophosphate synthase
MVGHSLKTTTTELFAPIQEGLAEVETRLRQVAQGQHHSLTAATEHLLSSGGKRIRPAVTLLTAGLFATDLTPAVSLAAAIEMLHTATLVHDDLIDGALLRRGVPTLSAGWSPDLTVLMGDYLFARAAGLAAQVKDARVINLFAETLRVIVNGEIAQKFSQGCIGRDAYYERIYAKTAALFVLCTRAAAMLEGADEASLEAVSEFGRQVGLAFQIVDDVLDFVGDPGLVGKPLGSDLRQGLFTLPAIYYVQTHPDDQDVRALLNGNARDPGVIPRLVAAVRQSDAISQALREARELAARGQQALAWLPHSPHAAALAALADYIVYRDL